jgi:hypothetical protein
MNFYVSICRYIHNQIIAFLERREILKSRRKNTVIWLEQKAAIVIINTLRLYEFSEECARVNGTVIEDEDTSIVGVTVHFRELKSLVRKYA